MSRQPTWDRALQIQGEMFLETERIGGLDVQLVYFRGFNECRASKWVSEPTALARLMTGVDCRGGHTQIGKVLSHIKAEAGKAKVNAVVYVGDAMEENIDRLVRQGGRDRAAGHPDLHVPGRQRRLPWPIAYREIARLTRGAYLRLDGNSAQALRDLLSAVAVYAAGGQEGARKPFTEPRAAAPPCFSNSFASHDQFPHCRVVIVRRLVAHPPVRQGNACASQPADAPDRRRRLHRRVPDS